MILKGTQLQKIVSLTATNPFPPEEADVLHTVQDTANKPKTFRLVSSCVKNRQHWCSPDMKWVHVSTCLHSSAVDL